MHPKSKEFLALQKTWYAKLEAKGFEDIEQEDGRLKAWYSRSTKNDRIPALREAKEEYYRLAGHFLFEHKFLNPKHKFIWTKHAEGISIRSIVALLAKKSIRIDKQTVCELIKRLRVLMLTDARKGKYG